MPALLRVFFLLGVLLAGVYIGIHIAEQNIQELQGTEGTTKAIQITPKDGKIEISVLGQVVKTKNPVEEVDQQKVIEMKDQVTQETDRLSSLGNFLGTEVRQGARELLGWMFSWLS